MSGGSTRCMPPKPGSTWRSGTSGPRATAPVPATSPGCPAAPLLRSAGTDAATGSFTSVPRRSLQGTYPFQTTNENVAGGLVHVYKTSTSTDLCMDAGYGSPAAGTALQMQPCSAGSLQQTFAYDTNLNL